MELDMHGDMLSTHSDMSDNHNMGDHNSQSMNSQSGNHGSQQHGHSQERPGTDMGLGVDGLSSNPADHFSGHGAPNDPAATAKQGEHQKIFSSIEAHLIDNSSRVHRAISSGSWFDPNTWEGGKIPKDDAMV
ncbi:MAG: hypothetical protein AAFN93_22355, partial [Bacteroidota bacterium]